jgi:hypothetical protein
MHDPQAWMRADKLADYITSVILKLQCMALCTVMTGMYKLIQVALRKQLHTTKRGVTCFPCARNFHLHGYWKMFKIKVWSCM